MKGMMTGEPQSEGLARLNRSAKRLYHTGAGAQTQIERRPNAGTPLLYSPRRISSLWNKKTWIWMKQSHPKILTKIQQIRSSTTASQKYKASMTFLGCPQQEVVVYFISCNTAIHLFYKFYTGHWGTLLNLPHVWGFFHLGTSSRCKKELRIRSASGILGRWSCGDQEIVWWPGGQSCAVCYYSRTC